MPSKEPSSTKLKIVGLLGFAATNRLATDDPAALGKEDLLAQLRHHIPLGAAAANERGVMNFVRMPLSVSCFLSIALPQGSHSFANANDS